MTKAIQAASSFLFAISLPWVLGCGTGKAKSASTMESAPILERPPYDAAILEKDIQNFEGLVKKDPNSSLGWSMLGSSYLQKAKIYDLGEFATKAEKAARRSLEIRTKLNSGAAVLLAESLLEQHRFVDAEGAIERALRMDPADAQAQKTKINILLELGKYDAAAQMMASTKNLDQEPGGLALLSRAAEINGNLDFAQGHLEKALSMIRQNLSAPHSSVAWLHTKLGELQWKQGRIEEAKKEFLTALKVFPNDYKALAALTRLYAGLGDWNKALEWGEKTLKIAKMTDVMGLVGDAHKQLGRASQAEEIYKQVEAMNKSAEHGHHDHAHGTKAHGHTHDRLYALFCADRNRNLHEAMHSAEADLAARKDVFGYMTYAWVAAKNGELPKAKDAIEKALSKGTKDPRLLYYAGLIYDQAGDTSKASDYLQAALKLNPDFDFNLSQRAKDVLSRVSKTKG